MDQHPSVRTPLSLFDEYMRRQELSIEDRQRMGIELLDTGRASQLVGFKLRDGRSSFLLPYPGEDYYRLRLLGDDVRAGAAKYLSARGSGSGPVYCPPWEHIDWADMRADVGRMVCIVEGEIKAYWGSRPSLGGPACIGIGGVDMQDGLFRGDWEWRGRRVLVCFDKDSGWAAGEWKPAVARALGRLCSRLEAAGASVWVLRLEGEVQEKVGLDDYLRSRQGDVSAWGELLKTAAPPPEWCEHMAWMLENCVMISGTNHAHIYTIGHGSRKSISDFHDTHVDKVRKGENGKNLAISKLWLHHPDRQTVLNYVMDPLREFGVTGNYLNLWEPFPVWEGSAGGDDVREDWQRFVQGIFGEHAGWVAAWVGHMLERPEEKCTQAVMLVTSVQGIGKSLFGDIVRDLMGVHGLECSVERMFCKFNAEMEGKVFVMVNELDVKFSAREGQLNELLTTETVMVEQKGKDVMVFPNLRRWYLTTNTASPCRLSRGQRRVVVVSPPRVEEDTRGEWGQWVRGRIASFRRGPMRMGAMAAIASWFREMLAGWEAEHGRWDPTAPVPETTAGDELALASRTGVQVLADEALELILAEGKGAIAPVRKKTDAKLVGEIILRCRAAGMIVASKVAWIDGKAVRYTTFEGPMYGPFEKDGSGCFKSHLEAETVKILDENLWGALLPLKQQLNL